MLFSQTMRTRILKTSVLISIFILQSFVTSLPVSANIVSTSSSTHQISSQSSYVEFSGASSATSSGLSEAYDGDSTTGSFARIRTYPCENYNNGPACTTGSFGQVVYQIQTTSSSAASFTLDFNHQMVAYCTINPKVTFSIWNTQSTTWLIFASESGTGGYTINQTYSSSYMDSSGEITLRWRAESGCSTNGSSDYIISRLYEFHVYSPDTDADGISDSMDDCPSGATGWVSNSVTDYDADGCQDNGEDTDDDNDGVEDMSDDCQTGHLDWISESITDYDGDGCHDSIEDDDDDNDGISDSSDSCQYGATFTSTAATDRDGDGCQDSSEDNDDDNDGIQDLADDCQVGALNWASNSSNDNDGDGCRDSDEDSDDDNDGYNDTTETDCLSDPLDPQSIPLDNDGTDGCDEIDPDDDNDGILDDEDDFPNNPSEDTDTDGDGIGNNEDTDDDWDGYNDTTEIECASDPLNNTSTPLNFDNDDLCDELDSDDDNDGYNDSIDLFPFNSIEWADFDGDGTGDASDTDDDDDGSDDAQEINCGTNPNDPQSQPQDTDNDGTCDGLDYDIDGDNWSNNQEAECGTSSMSNTSIPSDIDGDMVCDQSDNDIDGDNWSNSDEQDCGTNELDANSVPLDSNNNSICDVLEDDDNNSSGTNNGGNNGDDNSSTTDQNTNQNATIPNSGDEDSNVSETTTDDENMDKECGYDKPGIISAPIKLYDYWVADDDCGEYIRTDKWADEDDFWNYLVAPVSAIFGVLSPIAYLTRSSWKPLLTISKSRKMKKLLKNQRKEYDKLFNELKLEVLQTSPDDFDETMRIVSSRLITLCNDLKARGSEAVGHGEESAKSRAELNDNADNLYEEIFKKFEVLAQENFQGATATLANYRATHEELRNQYRQYRDEHNIEQNNLVESPKEVNENLTLVETAQKLKEKQPLAIQNQTESSQWTDQQLFDAGWTQEQIDEERTI